MLEFLRATLVINLSILTTNKGKGEITKCPNSHILQCLIDFNNYFILISLGSCESGFYSSVGGSVDDWLSTMQMSKCSASATRSMGSSLLTVSDLEEDLRAASAFLSSNKGQLISKCLFGVFKLTKKPTKSL